MEKSGEEQSPILLEWHSEEFWVFCSTILSSVLETINLLASETSSSSIKNVY